MYCLNHGHKTSACDKYTLEQFLGEIRTKCKKCMIDDSLLIDNRGFPYLGTKMQPISTKRWIMGNKNDNQKWTDEEAVLRKANYDREMIPYHVNTKLLVLEFPSVDFAAIPPRLLDEKRP